MCCRLDIQLENTLEDEEDITQVKRGCISRCQFVDLKHKMYVTSIALGSIYAYKLK